MLVARCLTLVSIFALAACGSQSSSASTTPPVGGPNDTYKFAIGFQNNTPHYAWLTRYWTTYDTAGWHIEDHPQCVAPRDNIGTTVYFHFEAYDDQVKIRAELKDRGDCGGPTLADVTSDVCHLNLDGDRTIYGNIGVYADGDKVLWSPWISQDGWPPCR